MGIDRVHLLVESFRKEVLSSPIWLAEKEVFEYEHQTLEVAAVLKLVRAAQGLVAIKALCEAGLVMDMGASIRCVFDAVEEVFFLLECYPDTPSHHVSQFVKNFFENTIDGYLDVETHQVARDKIRSARVRILAGKHDDATQRLLERIYKSFCGYTHASYVCIMEIYNQRLDSFSLMGIPPGRKRDAWAEYIELSCNQVLMAGAFTAHKLGKPAYFEAMMRSVS
jgi:hypothetical protein